MTSSDTRSLSDSVSVVSGNEAKLSISISSGSFSPSFDSQSTTFSSSVPSRPNKSLRVLIAVLLCAFPGPTASSTGCQACVQVGQRTAEGLSNRDRNAKRIRVRGDDVLVLGEVRLIRLDHLQSFRAGRFLVGAAGLVVLRQGGHQADPIFGQDA